MSTPPPDHPLSQPAPKPGPAQPVAGLRRFKQVAILSTLALLLSAVMMMVMLPAAPLFVGLILAAILMYGFAALFALRYTGIDNAWLERAAEGLRVAVIAILVVIVLMMATNLLFDVLDGPVVAWMVMLALVVLGGALTATIFVIRQLTARDE